MTLLGRHVFFTLLQTTLMIAGVLSAIILLTQSLKFLELIINAGASSGTFWVLSFLALPRLFEIVVPIAAMVAALFLYHRAMADSELTVMRAVGQSPMVIMTPLIYSGLVLTVFLMSVTMWMAPVSLTKMKEMRHVIKQQYSTVLFRPGVFNEIGNDMTVYIDEKKQDGTLNGLMLHDTRPSLEHPTTIYAKRGAIITQDGAQQVIVYDGFRHVFDHKKEVLQRLDFERYTIDLPDNDNVSSRYQEPDERNFIELFSALKNEPERDRHTFMIEIHKRIISPFLALCLSLVSVCFLIVGPISRRGSSHRILMGVLSVIAIQGGYLAAFNIAQEKMIGLIAMYGIVFLPILICFILISAIGDHIRTAILYYFRHKKERKT